MSKLREMTEMLRVSMIVPETGFRPLATDVNNAAMSALVRQLSAMLNATVDSQEVEVLERDELRDLKTFQSVVFRAIFMEGDAAAKNILAQWRNAKGPIHKLTIWTPASQVIKQIDQVLRAYP